jgi:hypothetical protein
MKMCKLLGMVGMALVTAIGTANAAPTMSATNLPIDQQLIDALTAQGKSQDDITALLTTLSGIQVYDDHQNPSSDQRGDRTKAKIYYSAPYLTASPTRSTVGADQFADSALSVLDDADDLLSSFELQAKEFRRLQDLRKSETTTLQSIDTALLTNLDPMKRTSLEALRLTVVAEIDRLTTEITDLVNAGSDGAAQLGLPLRHSIANAFVLQMSRLGLTPTSTEQGDLASDDPTQMVAGLASLRARAAEGQYGLRQVIFEAGFTTVQRDALRAYLALRPDVTTRSLVVQNMVVHPTAQTLIDQSGQYVTRNAVMQIRGVNLGNGGVCGSTSSCNVLIEYTDVGARSARFAGLSAQTPVLVPVTFEAEVRVAEPDFVGSIHCDFKTGWTAEGRADVKDGAIIYDGDLSNKIKYDSIDSGFGGCQFNITTGDTNSAYYHTLMDMDAFYRNLHTERQQSSKAEKDAYRASIEAELAYQQAHSQNRGSGGWFSDVLHLVTGGSFISGIAGFLVGETRDFYWHTTTLDTHSIDAINVNESYNVHNTTATRKFAFDGFPLVCYTPTTDGGRLMKACPDAQAGNADDESQTGDDSCPETDIFGDCIGG